MVYGDLVLEQEQEEKEQVIRSSSTGLSFACRSWSNYFSNDFISNCRIDSDNVIYFNCDYHYLCSSKISQSYLQGAWKAWFYDIYKDIRSFGCCKCSTVYS